MIYVRAGNLDRNYDDDREEVKKERDQMINEFNKIVEESEG